MAELFDIEFLVNPFPFKSKATILGSFMFETNFSIRLCEVEESKSMILFDLLKVIPSFIVKAESSSIAFVWSVVVCVYSGMFSTGLVGLISSTETANSCFKILSVNVTESQHVETNHEILVKFGDVFECKFW